jgi:acetyl-CoA carboxylase carboxyltransferase component
VPKIVLTVNHASGAGYYAMVGQGFDPDFIFSWPRTNGSIEGESAVQAVSEAADKLKKTASSLIKSSKRNGSGAGDLRARPDAKYAAARGFVDAVIAPELTFGHFRACIILSLNWSGSSGLFLPASLCKAFCDG